MPDLLAPGSVVAGYRISRLIGRGATGAVYLAEDGEGREVALKLLIPELAHDARFRERFLREAQIAAGLDEPHIVPTVATGEHDGTLYLAMAYIDGRDLREILKEDGPLETERAVDLVGQVASALDAAHALGLIHRDVKPGNVLVAQTAAGEHAYLCDFGLAKHVSSVNSLTGERAFVGTIAYISPEQIEGGAIDARADIYSLGCVLFECLTGEAPFARESELATVYAHINEPPPRATDVQADLPAGFDDVLAKALAKAPGDRYASCADLATASSAAMRGERPRHRAPRHRLLLAALAAAVALAAIAAFAVVRHDDGTPAAARLAIAPKTLGLIDARSHEVVGGIAFASQPWDVAFDRRAAWVLLGDERRVARIDLATRRRLSTARLPFRPGGITTGDGATWVTEDGGPGLVRLDGASGALSATYSVPIKGERNASPTGIAFGAGSVWVARGPETVRVDPANGRTLRRIPTPLAASWIVFAGGAVWVASAENGRIVKIDPVTNRVSAATPLHGTVTDLAVNESSAWVSIVPDNIVYRLSADDGSVLATIAGGPWPSSLSLGNGLWIADARGRQIVHVDETGGRERILTAGAPLMTRYHAGLLWSSVVAPEAAAAATGEELRIPLADDFIGRADPAVSGGPVFRQLAYSTCSHLVNYPDAEGAAGRRLVPEVARGLPAVSRDGRTYTFRVRPGFRFSPPSGQNVTAETFRFTIERAASPAFATGGHPNTAAQLLDDVVGMPAFTSGRAAHIRGIRVHGDTIAFTLTRPAGDFTARLSSSDFCPVPIGTRAVEGGGSDSPIAMTGPYYVVSAGHGRVVVERNPNYTGDRPRRTARIVYTLGVTAAEAVSSVESGRADYLNGVTIGSDPSGGPLALGGALERAFGLASRAGRAGKARYVPSPAPLVDAIVLNTRRPLFRDVRMRRAAAYALDRSALARVYGEQPSDRLVPPAVSGAAGAIAYPSEPDLAAARRLAGRGPRRAATLYYCGEPINGRIAEIVRSNLAEIGIDVRVDASLGCLTGPETRRLKAADMQLVTPASPVADPASFVEVPLGAAYFAPGYWNDTRLRGLVTSARRLRGAARLAAYRKLERSLVRDAVPAVVFGSGVNPEFFSARVGCKLSLGALNVVDLGALCLHR